METDRPIKVLFERQGQSLLPFIGERRPGVRVTGAESVALSVPARTIDSVLRLERDGLVWYRHLEFQAQRDPGIPRRCFEYNSRLILHYDAVVFTTVLYLLPGADKDVPDAFRLYLGDWLAYEWRFDVVRLWEIDAAGTSPPTCARRRGGWTRCRGRGAWTRCRFSSTLLPSAMIETRS